MSEFRRLKKRAKKDLEDVKLILRRRKKILSSKPKLVEAAQGHIESVKRAIKSQDIDDLDKAVGAIEDLIEVKLDGYRPSAFWETVKAFAIAVGIALIIRWLVVEPFRIPSGSMIPTLLIGDQLLVNKMTYGPSLWVPYLDPDYSDECIELLKQKGSPRFEFRIAGHKIVIVAQQLWMRRPPRRGEVVVFRFPRDPRRPQDAKEDYIKRVVGLPGDKVEITGGRLYINDVIQEEVMVGPFNGPVGKNSYRELDLFEEVLQSEPEDVAHAVLHLRPRRKTELYYYYGPVTVPEGMFLAMGDNRDSSWDSRGWGYVPMSHLKGKAMFIHLPLDPENHYMPRWERFFKPVR